MNRNNPWDDLVKYFAIPDNDEWPTVDNIFIAWPVIIQFLETYLPASQDKQILDFGCGTGIFTAKLSSIGYQAIGIDPSSQMIQTGKRTFGASIKLKTGDIRSLSEPAKFDAIVAIMSLHFVDDINELFMQFKQILHPKGLLIFAVYNPTYVTDCIKQNAGFNGFDSIENPKYGNIIFTESINVPIFIRTAEEFNMLLNQYNFKCIQETYPPFTEDFLKKYPNSGSTENPEYMILGYRQDA